MYKAALLAFALFTSPLLLAQDENEAKYQEKLKKDFVGAIDWVQDYDKALELSKQSGKPIFGYFTRSYAP